MLSKTVLRHILTDDGMTRGLGDAEARMLVEWVVERADSLELGEAAASDMPGPVRTLCRRGKAISKFVELWSNHQSRGAACQLAGAERFAWPMPNCGSEPYEVMQHILDWEDQYVVSNRRAS